MVNRRFTPRRRQRRNACSARALHVSCSSRAVHLALSAARVQDRDASSLGIAMPVRRKVFRIEEMQLAGARPRVAEAASVPPQQHILAELAALRGLLEDRRDGAPKVDPK